MNFQCGGEIVCVEIMNPQCGCEIEYEDIMNFLHSETNVLSATRNYGLSEIPRKICTYGYSAYMVTLNFQCRGTQAG